MNRWLLLGILILITRVLAFQTAASQAIAPTKLPQPSGRFGIGRVSYDWKDSARPDLPAVDRNARRELMVYLWYPTKKTNTNASGVYLPGAKQIDPIPEAQQRMRNEFESAWPLIVSGAITSHAIANAPMAPSTHKFPVVLFAHGMRSSSFAYTGLLEDLVSHGYAVAAIEAGAAVVFPNGRVVIPYEDAMVTSRTPQERLRNMIAWAKEGAERTATDLRFVLDRIIQLNDSADPSMFSGRLDINRVAVLGHSAGGTAASRACQLDQRFKACVSLEGKVNPEGAFFNYPDSKSPTQPFLLVEIDRPQPTDEDLLRMGETPADIRECSARKEEQLRNCAAGSYDVLLKGRGLVHGSFSDEFVLASANNSADNEMALHNLQLTETITRAFLDKYLKLEPEPLFENGHSLPEMTVKKY